MYSVTNKPKEKCLIIKYENGKIDKVPYNPSVNILHRFTKKELENMTKDEKLQKRHIIVEINDKEKYLSLSKLCSLALSRSINEKDVIRNADLYLYNETVLRILAAALSNKDVLCIEKPPKNVPTNKDIYPSRDYALVLSKGTVFTDLESDVSYKEQTFKTVVF